MSCRILAWWLYIQLNEEEAIDVHYCEYLLGQTATDVAEIYVCFSFAKSQIYLVLNSELTDVILASFGLVFCKCGVGRRRFVSSNVPFGFHIHGTGSWGS